MANPNRNKNRHGGRNNNGSRIPGAPDDGTAQGGNGSGGDQATRPNPYDLGAQLGDPAVVRQLVQRALRGQYGPAIGAARRNVRQVGGYFDDYRNRLQQINQGQQAYNAQLLGQMGAFGQQLNVGLQGAMPQAAPTGGMPSQQVGQQAQQAAAVRAGMLGNMGGLAANQGLAQSNYTANRQASSVPLEIQAKNAAKQAVRDLLKEKGAAKSDMLSKLREAYQAESSDRRNFRLVRQEFGLDKAKAAVDAADTVADNRRDAQQDARDRRDERRENREERQDERQDRQREEGEVNEWGYADAQWRAMSPEQRQAIMRRADRDGSSGENREEQREERQEGRRVVVDIRSLYDDFSKRTVTDNATGEKRPPSREEIIEKINADTNYSPGQIRIGLVLAEGRRLTPAEYRRAKALGLPVPKGQRPVHVKPKPGDPRDQPGPQGH